MTYAKLIDGRIQYAPRTLTADGLMVANPTAEQYASAGWFPLRSDPYPDLQDGYTAEVKYRQTDTEIVQSWRVYKDHRPLNDSEVLGLMLRRNIQTLTVDDATAVRMRQYYPDWTDGTAYKVGYKIQYNGKLWKCRQAHASQPDWRPGTGTELLWTVINEYYAGDEYDPIPYEGNMVLEKGKYYTQDGKLYLCIRNSEIAVFEPLSKLATMMGGQYVKVKEATV